MPVSPRPPQDPAVASLTRRVDRLEGAVCVVAALGAALALLLGCLLPYLTYAQDGDDVTHSVFTFGFGALTYRDQDGRPETAGTVLGVAFVGLLVVVLATVLALGVVGSRSGTPGTLRWIRPVAVLLDLGVIGMWFTVAFAARGDRLIVHAGPYWLTAGAVLASLLLLTEGARAWWVREAPR